MLDGDTCLVNHLLNAWFCFNANHICFSKCLLSLLLLKELQDGATLESAHFNLDDDDYLEVLHYYTATPSLSHGDEDRDPWTDLSQGRGDDAEHPSTITMDATPPPQGRRGPWTRARARAIENEVTSFLFEFHSDSHVSQILPQMETLCILRYFGDRHEEARRQGRYA